MTNDKKPTNSKFTPWIVYAIVFTAFVGLTYYKGVNFVEPTKISSSKFDDLLNSGKIENVNVYNKTDGEAFLTVAALKEKEFSKVALDVNKKVNKGPHFIFDIGNDEIFQNKLAKAAAEGKLKEYDFKPKSDWLGYFFDALPLILILGIWLIIMRRMSGSAGGPEIGRAHV